jgi:hypothetical protein
MNARRRAIWKPGTTRRSRFGVGRDVTRPGSMYQIRRMIGASATPPAPLENATGSRRPQRRQLWGSGQGGLAAACATNVTAGWRERLVGRDGTGLRARCWNPPSVEGVPPSVIARTRAKRARFQRFLFRHGRMPQSEGEPKTFKNRYMFMKTVLTITGI